MAEKDVTEKTLEVYNADLERGETTMCEVLDRVENRGIQQGVNEGMQLISYLLSENRMEDVQRVTTDEAYRDKLMDELLGKRGLERT